MLRDKIFDVGIITKENVDNKGIIALPTDVAIIINNFVLLEGMIYPIIRPIKVFILDTEFKNTSYPKFFDFDPSDTFLFVRVYRKEGVVNAEVYIDIRCAFIDITDLVKIMVHNISRIIILTDPKFRSILNILNFYNKDQSPELFFGSLILFSLTDGTPASSFSKTVIRSLYSLSRAYN